MRKKSEDRRQAILETATAVFLEMGYSTTSMSVIAEKWGGSKATIYNHFTSKENLYIEVIGMLGDKFLADIYKALNPDADLNVTLQTLGELIVKAVCSHEMVLAQRNAISEANTQEIGKLFYERGPVAAIKRIEEYFNECMERGKLKKFDSLVAAHHFGALLRAECQDPLLFGVREEFSDAEISAMVERAISAFLNGYSCS